MKARIRRIRLYWAMSAILALEIAAATHFVYLPVCVSSFNKNYRSLLASSGPSAPEDFPDVVAEADQIHT